MKVLADRYEVGAKLGQGGMGVVFAGVDRQLDRQVAIKLIQPRLLEVDAGPERFLIEAKAAARIHSAHVVSVFDYGITDDDERFLVMENIVGGSLSAALRAQGRFDSDRAVAIAVQICHALEAAHDAGVIHRDIKPANIMLTERDNNPDFVKVLDFGVAKLMGKEVTQTGALMGTSDYMAPELVRGEPLDGRADMYALGGVLYRMVTGTKLFTEKNSMPGYHSVFTKPVPPRERTPTADISDGLEAVILRCLEKEPDNRFPNMAAARDALLRIDQADEEAPTVTIAAGVQAPKMEHKHIGPEVATDAPTEMMSEVTVDGNTDVTVGLSAEEPATLTFRPEETLPSGETRPPEEQTTRWLSAALVGALVVVVVLLGWAFTREGAPSSTPAPHGESVVEKTTSASVEHKEKVDTKNATVESAAPKSNKPSEVVPPDTHSSASPSGSPSSGSPSLDPSSSKPSAAEASVPKPEPSAERKAEPRRRKKRRSKRDVQPAAPKDRFKRIRTKDKP